MQASTLNKLKLTNMQLTAGVALLLQCSAQHSLVTMGKQTSVRCQHTCTTQQCIAIIHYTSMCNYRDAAGKAMYPALQVGWPSETSITAASIMQHTCHRAFTQHGCCTRMTSPSHRTSIMSISALNTLLYEQTGMNNPAGNNSCAGAVYQEAWSGKLCTIVVMLAVQAAWLSWLAEPSLQGVHSRSLPHPMLCTSHALKMKIPHLGPALLPSCKTGRK
jgi:hypothetical protein